MAGPARSHARRVTAALAACLAPLAALAARAAPGSPTPEPIAWGESPAASEAPLEPPTPFAPAPPFQLPSTVPPWPEIFPSWIDASHAWLESSLFWPFVHADQFFSDERGTDLPVGESFFRWRNDLKVRADGTFGYQTTARADLRFPFLTRKLERLRLTIEGDTVDALDRVFPGDTPVPNPATGRVSAALGYRLFDTLRVQADAQAGLLFSWPPGWYVRLRLRHVQPLGPVGLSRLAVSGFWQTNTGWGTRQEASLERLLVWSWLMGRLAGTDTLTERSRGLEWGSELALLATLNTTTGLALVGNASGASDVGRVVEVWRALARGRRDVFRRWLYLELEPQLTWTRQPGGGRSRAAAIILRLDVFFQAVPAAPID